MNIPPTHTVGRWYVFGAAVLWSTGGLITRLFQIDTPIGLHSPTLTPMQIAFYRSFFAGLVLLPLLRRPDLTYRPTMLFMVAGFSMMSVLYLSALALGSAAQAIFVQNLAPFGVAFVSVHLLGEVQTARGNRGTAFAVLGVFVLLGGALYRDGTGSIDVQAMAVGSAVGYGIVIFTLRRLRAESAVWLVVLNHFGSAVVMGTVMAVLLGSDAWAWFTTPSAKQIAALAVFGVFQLAVPYVLFTRGLKILTVQEAGLLGLAEPLLNPVWAYLISPETDTPTITTAIGALMITLAMVRRYT